MSNIGVMSSRLIFFFFCRIAYCNLCRVTEHNIIFKKVGAVLVHYVEICRIVQLSKGEKIIFPMRRSGEEEAAAAAVFCSI